jgi:cyclophilin family peptidyl-prolyl cis-trans isomerase
MKTLLCGFALLTSLMAPVSAAQAQPADQAAAATADDFPKLYGEWKQYLTRFAQLRQTYQTDPKADKQKLQDEAQQIGKQVQALMPRLVESAKLAYAANPNQDKQLSEFLVAALADAVNSDDYERASELAKLLVDNKLENPNLDILAGVALFNTNEFEAAGKHLQAAKDAKAVNQDGLRLLDSVEDYQQKWARELKYREADAKAGNLPRVKLETSQGDIVIELFEDQAPNTVANFISLVEKKFYDGLSFHRVIPGFMAQGGDPNGDGSGGPKYTIPDEVGNPDHREHFRGSLSMAKTQAPDSGGSQFFLCFVPTSHLDGLHTVFGRVVEGMDVLAKLTRTEGVPGRPTPDKIVKATVISKRNHPYQPKTKPE